MAEDLVVAKDLVSVQTHVGYARIQEKAGAAVAKRRAESNWKTVHVGHEVAKAEARLLVLETYPG